MADLSDIPTPFLLDELMRRFIIKCDKIRELEQANMELVEALKIAVQCWKHHSPDSDLSNFDKLIALHSVQKQGE